MVTNSLSILSVLISLLFIYETTDYTISWTSIICLRLLHIYLKHFKSYMTPNLTSQKVSEIRIYESDWWGQKSDWEQVTCGQRVETTKERVKLTKKKDFYMTTRRTPQQHQPPFGHLSLVPSFSVSPRLHIFPYVSLIASLLTFPFTLFAPGTESGRENSDEGNPCECKRKIFP